MSCMQSLERRLGLFSVITISISSMLGSGIFVLPGIGFNITGPSLFLAFLLSAITILPAAMSKAELATAMPSSGGTYIYIERTFGPLAGTVAGLGLYLSILLKASFALIGLGTYFAVFSTLPLLPTILVFLFFIVVLNIFGVGKVSSFLTIILILSIASLSVIVVYSIPFWNTDNLTPFLTHDLSGLASATALVFVAFAGVTKVAAIAEEVKTPEKNLPRGILLSLFIVTALYCLISFVLAGVFETSEIALDIKPIHTLSEKVAGYWMGIFMAFVAVLTMINTSNAGILAGSRFPFAMSRDSLLPAFLGRLHPKFLTPLMSIFVSGIIIAFVLVTMDVAKIAKLASAFMIMIYMIENLAVIVLRENRPQWYDPGYKAPFYPVLQILGILSGLALLYAMGLLAVTAIVSIAIPGIAFYYFYSKNKTDRRGVLGIKGKRSDLIEQAQLPAKHFNFFDAQRTAQVVVVLFGKEKSSDMLIDMGIALANLGHVEVATVIEVPEQTTLHDISDEPAGIRSLRRRVEALTIDGQKKITFDSIVSHDVARSIFDIGNCVHCDWMLVEWKGRTAGSLTTPRPIGGIKSHLHCHLATFKDAGIKDFKKIMILLNDDHNDKVIIQTADHLSKVKNATVTLMKFISFDASEQDQTDALADLEKHALPSNPITYFKLLQSDNLVYKVVSESINFDLLIMGSQKSSFWQGLIGTADDKIISKAACSVLSVHASSFED